MRASKLIAAVVGIPLTIVSLALAVGGGVAMAVPDEDGWVSAGPIRVQTDSAAVISDDLEIDFGSRVARGNTFMSWGEIPAELEITSRNDKSVFIGIATQDDAAAYLAGVARARLTSLDQHHDIELIPGAYEVTSPLDTDIWVASSVDGILDWDIESGDWAVIALNTDGSPGIDVNVDAAAKVSFLRPLGALMLAGGILGIGSGIALTYFGVRRTRSLTSRPPVRPSPTSGPLVSE